jgi:hypothetical protein
MIKRMRWLWTTGQLYNSITLKAGIVYNGSPTTSIVDFNKSNITISDPNSNLYAIGVDDDGALTLTPTSDGTYLVTLVLADSSGQNWQISVDALGAITTAKSSAAAVTNPVLASNTSGFPWRLTVDTDGTPITTRIFAPDVSVINPGSRVFVKSVINGVSGVGQGKYILLYFTGIGILSQYSMDLIFSGSRN